MKTPRKTHHMVLTYIEATQEELESAKWKIKNHKTFKQLNQRQKNNFTKIKRKR